MSRAETWWVDGWSLSRQKNLLINESIFGPALFCVRFSFRMGCKLKAFFVRLNKNLELKTFPPRLRPCPRGVLFNMPDETNDPPKKRDEKRETENAKRKLARPPKDKRE